jgi:ATP/maltotriose-dependent transcriptional regulator MalT
MTSKQAILDQLASDAHYKLTQAAAEGAARRGEFGPERQALALSEAYKVIRAAGHPSTAAIREAGRAKDYATALALIEQAERELLAAKYAI